MLDPSGPPLPTDQADSIIRYGAVLMDVIWFSRNQLLHHGKQDDIATLIKQIHRLYVDYSQVWIPSDPPQPLAWIPPLGNVLEVNFDAAIRHDYSMLAAVYGNSSGLLLFVWTKRIPPSTSVVGEARAALLQEACLTG